MKSFENPTSLSAYPGQSMRLPELIAVVATIEHTAASKGKKPCRYVYPRPALIHRSDS